MPFRATLVIMLITTLATTLTHGATGRPSRVVLDNVDRCCVPEPLFQGVPVIISYRGETYAAAYLLGISGAGFRIRGPCLSLTLPRGEC